MSSENRNSVSERHRKEWSIFRQQYYHILDNCPDEKDAKAIKQIAEIIKVAQEGERKAWGFIDETPQTDSLQIGWLS